MRVYSNTGGGQGTVLCTPGKDNPDVPEFQMVAPDRFGHLQKVPAQLRVTFTDGCAHVSRPLGRYLIRQRLAKRFGIFSF